MIIRRIHTHSFTVIPNAILQDNDLSLKARGLLVYLLSMPLDWRINREDLSNRFKEGKWAISSGMLELAEAGYAKRVFNRSVDGKMTSGSVWVVTDEKGNFAEFIEQIPSAGKPGSQGSSQSGDSPLQNTCLTKDTTEQRTLCLSGDSQTDERDKKGRFTPKANIKSDAKDVLAYLAEKTGKGYESEDHLTNIVCRLQSPGVTVSEVKKMIDRQCVLWLGDPKMRTYLRPKTLFAKVNFAEYYDCRNYPVEAPATNGNGHGPSNGNGGRPATVKEVDMAIDLIDQDIEKIEGLECRNPDPKKVALYEKLKKQKMELFQVKRQILQRTVGVQFGS